jgi:prevent-host-death family protein
MARRVSVAEARERFSWVLREAEAGRAVEITRRGRPVAVIASPADFARAAGGSPSFGEAMDAFRAATPASDLLAEDAVRDLRSREPGRDVSL